MHTRRLKIVNKSSESRKIQINTSQSPFFRFVYNKKSKIAPGMHETILVHFHPNDYSFFSSHIRLRLQVNEPRTVFLPKLTNPRAGLHESNKTSTFNSPSHEGTQRARAEVFVVTIEAFPKMNLSTRGRYLPQMIGDC